jgi:predicted metal-binding membrane protein
VLAPALCGWLVLVWGALNMDSPAAELAMPMGDWSAANWLAVFIMWAVMMAAMMLPSVMPMTMTFANLNRRRGEAARTLPFLAAYVALWTLFSGLATIA